jgi:hypothetical protein
MTTTRRPLPPDAATNVDFATSHAFDELGGRFSRIHEISVSPVPVYPRGGTPVDPCGPEPPLGFSVDDPEGRCSAAQPVPATKEELLIEIERLQQEVERLEAAAPVPATPRAVETPHHEEGDGASSSSFLSSFFEPTPHLGTTSEPEKK